MFRSSFQDGPYFEVFSSQLSDSFQTKWKTFGPTSAIRKEYCKDCKSWVFVLEGDTAVTKMRLPKDDNENLCLLQPFCILQIMAPPGQRRFSLDFSILDTRNNRRQIFLSTIHKELSVTPLHAKIPLTISHRGMWINLCLDMRSLVCQSFKGHILRSIESITIHANCKIRRIFTMKKQPDTTNDNVEVLPKSMRLNMERSSYTQILNMDMKKVTRLKNKIFTDKDPCKETLSRNFEKDNRAERKCNPDQETNKTLINECRYDKITQDASIGKTESKEQEYPQGISSCHRKQYAMRHSNEGFIIYPSFVCLISYNMLFFTGSDNIEWKTIKWFSYMDEYKLFLRSKVIFASLKIPANGYPIQCGCDNYANNCTRTAIDIKAEERVFTFFSFPISVPAESSNICINGRNLDQYYKGNVMGNNDGNSCQNGNVLATDTNGNNENYVTNQGLLGASDSTKDEIEDVAMPPLESTSSHRKKLATKANVKSSLLREISRTFVSRDSNWKDLNLSSESETHWDYSVNELSNFISPNCEAKNFGESITIDEDTASSSDGEECTPRKLYPAQSIVSRYVSEIRHNNILASFQSNPRESMRVCTPGITASVLSNNSNYGWHDIVREDDNSYSNRNNPGQTGDELLDLLYDSHLNCYFDPKTHKYYELVD